MSPSKAAEQAEAARLLEAFVAAGAAPLEASILQPAGTLLDLYGEDIRARAFTTSGPFGDELMLRPDFTVPVVQMHLNTGAETARYAYAGEVFRRQEEAPDRPSEYLQAGVEIFGGDTPAETDAEVFALFYRILAPLSPRIATGDIGILTSAVEGLRTSPRRRAALLRHIWRPTRFRALLMRFAGQTPVPPHRTALLEQADPMQNAGPEIGLRGARDVAERIDALRADADEPAISASEVAMIDAILDCREQMPRALSRLQDIAVDLPAIRPALVRLKQRMNALDALGIPPDTVPFEASHGRRTMEYYDGFVFSFSDGSRPDFPPLATGGRYDALTRALGVGSGTGAVGGMIRPALTLMAGDGA